MGKGVRPNLTNVIFFNPFHRHIDKLNVNMNEKNKVLTCKYIVKFSVARILEHLYLVGVLVIW